MGASGYDTLVHWNALAKIGKKKQRKKITIKRNKRMNERKRKKEITEDNE